MKKLFTLTVLGLGLSLQAQYYVNNDPNADMNPYGLNNDLEYPVGSGLDPSWTSFQGTSATAVWSAAQTIPFTFSFNGSAVTQYKVSTSGVLTFDVATAMAAPGFTASALPSASVPDMSVCTWGIRSVGANDNIVKKTFGTAPYRQHWIFFTSYTGLQTSDYVYFSIVLEETTNNIYIVDQRNYGTTAGMSLGIQINSTTALAMNNYTPVAGTNADASDNGFYEFIYGTRPAEDMHASHEPLPLYLILGAAPFTIQTDFISYGANNVTSYDMNYSVNGGPAVTGAVTANIATQATHSATHPTTWTPAVSGTYNIQVWATNINGNADAYTRNDTLDFQVVVVDTMVPRIVCMEVFTSSTCVPCVAGNANMDNNVVPSLSPAEYTIIKYQQNFPGNGDPYSTTESVNRRAYYGINSIPRMEMDGQWDQNASSLTVPIFNQFQDEPAFMEISIPTAYYSGTNITVNAQIMPLITYQGSNFRYHIVVIENQTTGNVATNGETSFNYVMMNMHPTETGTAVTALNANVAIPVNATIPMAGTNVEQMSDLKVVIFVQDNTTKEILQSQWVDVVPNSVQDLDANGNGINQLYPNPAIDQVTMEYTVSENQNVNWTMTNMMGQVVRTGENEAATAGVNRVNIGTADLAEGVYFVNLTTNEGTFTQRIVVSRD